MTGAAVAETDKRALMPSLSLEKSNSAPSGTPANANRPSAPTTADNPVPVTPTRTPAGLAFAIPSAMKTCPDNTPLP
jgi:hypothetical protein